MAKGNPVREKVEPGIYRRTDANGRAVLEISWRDAQSHQRRRRVEGGIKAARKALADAHSARGRGERIAADPRMKFSDAADTWWEARAIKLRPTTQAVYGSCLKHLRQRFGNSRLTDISAADVAAFVTAQQRAGFKGWTIKGQLTVMSSVYQHASRHLGFAGASPVAALDRVERPSTQDERDKRVLTGDELARLLGSVDKPYRLIFEFAAETGARLSETLGIVWSNVDLDSSAVTFTHQLVRGGQRAPLKTKRSRRTIEITPSLASKLREHKVASPLSGPHDFVFTSRTGKPHDHRNIGGRVLARAVKRAGLEAVERDGQVVEPAPTFHNLRHSHGSALIGKGWDIAEVSARLGHADVATTMRVYVHDYEKVRRSDDRRSRLAELYSAGGIEPGGEVVSIAASAPAAAGV